MDDAVPEASFDGLNVLCEGMAFGPASNAKQQAGESRVSVPSAREKDCRILRLNAASVCLRPQGDPVQGEAFLACRKETLDLWRSDGHMRTIVRNFAIEANPT